MNYLRNFLPWIAFGALSGVSLKWAAVAALAVGIVVIVRDRRAGVPGDALVLEISTACYFLALAAVALSPARSAVAPIAGLLSFGWLALTAWASLALGRPFTLGIARRMTPREYWDLPAFRAINVVITRAWAISFTLTAAAIGICEAAHAGGFATAACQVVGFVVPAVFTQRYPKVVQSRLQAANAPTA